MGGDGSREFKPDHDEDAYASSKIKVVRDASKDLKRQAIVAAFPVAKMAKPIKLAGADRAASCLAGPAISDLQGRVAPVVASRWWGRLRGSGGPLLPSPLLWRLGWARERNGWIPLLVASVYVF
nr:uncharacterized protein LOC120967901 [Aegilops tauschii subsp. strangulata]